MESVQAVTRFLEWAHATDASRRMSSPAEQAPALSQIPELRIAFFYAQAKAHGFDSCTWRFDAARRSSGQPATEPASRPLTDASFVEGVPWIRWASSLLAATPRWSPPAPAASADIEVMTQNQYVGARILSESSRSLTSTSRQSSSLQIRAASLPAERARALAALIDRRGPALAGLQEVYLFTCVELDPIPGDFKGCEDPSIAGAFTDQLADTLAALGGKYVEAATVVNLDFPEGARPCPPHPLSFALPGLPIQMGDVTIRLIRVDRRDVIIARAGIPFRRSTSPNCSS